MDFKKIFILGIISLLFLGIPSVSAEEGTFVVSSDPYGADVTFDGTYVGTTSVRIPVDSDNLPPHTITVSREGYETWQETYHNNPEPGYPILVSPVLVPSTGPVPPLPPLTPIETPTLTITIPMTPIGGDYGWYYVTSVPSGADVLFNGAYVGDTPVTIKVMSTGTPHNSVSVKKQGYSDWYQEYNTNPRPGETIPIQAYLQPIITTGSISVDSYPQGARTTIDNGYQLTTPCTFTDIRPGYHTIAVNMYGYQPYSTRVLVESGKESSVSATLIPIEQTGSLQASSSPSGADLYVDGSFRGNTPVLVSGLSTGTHPVSLKRYGYMDWSQSVSVTAGRTTTINPVLNPYPPEPRVGDISVTSVPPGAYVYLDANYEGITSSGQSLDITGVTPGIHTVLLEHSHYQDYSANIEVSAGTTTRVSASLQPAPEPQQTTGVLVVSSEPSGAAIFLNNQYMGITPASLRDVSAGSYTLLLRENGYEDYADTILVSGGTSTEVSLTLTPLPTPTQTTLQTPTPVPVPAVDMNFPVLFVLIGIIICLIAVIGYILKKKR
ncbi:MAG: PEGA domain-containing protein [Methanospirillaceae archaeon]|nr:PEGA domain-containing protein [Methanospirillaceae archaeon]